ISLREKMVTAPAAGATKPGAKPDAAAQQKPATPPAADTKPADAADAESAPPDAAETERPPAEKTAPAAPAGQSKTATTTTRYNVYEFHTDEWGEGYTRRIDATIAALKSAGVPVLWVGLPSIRGPKSTADMAYLNDFYRARAEKAGIT